MPRYFFDTEVDTALVPDEEGADLPSGDAARQEARAALATIARDAVDRGGQTCAVLVRDEAGGTVYICSMAITEQGG